MVAKNQIACSQARKRARIHFIPAPKDRVFVTLCAPEVIKYPECIPGGAGSELAPEGPLQHRREEGVRCPIQSDAPKLRSPPLPPHPPVPSISDIRSSAARRNR